MAKVKDEQPAPSGVRISFASMGKDFKLDVKGPNLEDCEKAFDRLFEKVKVSLKGEKEGGEGHYR